MNRETDIRNIRNTESEKSTKEMKKEAKVSTKLLTSTAMTGGMRKIVKVRHDANAPFINSNIK
jgi:hypothetical protein